MLKSEQVLAPMLNAVSGVGALLIAFMVPVQLSISGNSAKVLGVLAVAFGMGIVVWAGYHLRGGIFGRVEPSSTVLVQSGPYRVVRHPIYLGMTVALAGAVFSVRSWPALLAVFLLFFPTEIYRARLEEVLLSRLHGRAWEEYAGQTRFMIPFLW